MGTVILLFFLCVKEHFARNLLLLLRACVSNIFLSCAHLMSSRSRIFSGYHRLSATRSSITSVNHNRTSLFIKKKGCSSSRHAAPGRTFRGASPYPLLGDKGCSVGGARNTTPLSSIIPHQILRYSSLRLDHNKIHHISPWFITGFTDAEGCFNVGLQKNPNGKFYVRPLFRIKVHSRDSLLLLRIKNYFGGIGNIYTNSKDSNYTVRSLDEILKIILHFDNYPLITKKKSDYILFKQIIQKIVEGEHLSAKGLQEIVNIRSSINLGLSDSLKTIFPNTVPVVRPEIANITIPHPEWMAGFVTGAPKNNLRLAISILGGCSKNIKTRRSLEKNLRNLYGQYCSTRLYSTYPAAVKANKHMVISSCGELVPENNNSLVVWGLNLTSTAGNNFTRSELAMIKLPYYERSVIIGLILSDGWLRFVGSRSKNAQFGFLQSGANGMYF